MRTLPEWLDFLENRHQQEVQLRLVNAKAVAERLDLLNPSAVVITVTGTNGKGSTVASLEAIYCAAGYRVGTYTSPHVLVFNERIRVNQQLISDQALCDAFAVVEEVRGEISLTYFEMATLAALLHFKQAGLDVIILEVGIGGRLDATNIIDSDLAIITTVDLDHQDYLGDNVEDIGYEKAGILRANKPFVYADVNPPKRVVEEAKRLNSDMHCLDKDYFYRVEDQAFCIQTHADQVIELPIPNINKKAASAAVIASVCLSALLPVSHEHWVTAMQTVNITARLQLVDGPVKTLFDVAHNPQAVSLLADFIEQYKPKGQVHAIFSGLKDKNLCGLIKPMRSYVTFWYPALLSGKRAASESLLLEAFATENMSVSECFSNPELAYCAAVERAKPDDLIVVYGSFLTVGAVMGIQNEVFNSETRVLR